MEEKGIKRERCMIMTAVLKDNIPTYVGMNRLS